MTHTIAVCGVLGVVKLLTVIKRVCLDAGFNIICI